MNNEDHNETASGGEEEKIMTTVRAKVPLSQRGMMLERSRSRGQDKKKLLAPTPRNSAEKIKQPPAKPKERREPIHRPERGSVKTVNTEKLTITNIAFPISLAEDPSTQKKFKTNVEYIYEGKRYRKHISFGKKNVQDFIDTKLPATKQAVLKDIKAYFSPLQANYYRVHLLNEAETLTEAYITLRKKHGLLL